MDRRTFIAASTVALGALAGCARNSQEENTPAQSDGPSTETPTAKPPDAGGEYGSTAGPPDDGVTVSPSDSSGLAEKTSRPEPDHPIRLTNRHNTTRELSMRVSQNGSVVHSETLEVEPGAEFVVYNLREADPDGIEEFDVSATVGNRTESVTVRTDDCFGDVNLDIQSDGSLFVTYSIC